MNSYPTINKPRKYLLENGVYYRDMNETDQIEPHETEHYYYWKYLPSGEWGIKRVAVLKFYNFGDLLTGGIEFHPHITTGHRKEKMLPTIFPEASYTEIKSDKGILFFSYKTLIGFSTGTVFRARRNGWGNTTAKHLNRIDGGTEKAKLRRLSTEDFHQAYQYYWEEEHQTSNPRTFSRNSTQ